MNPNQIGFIPDTAPFTAEQRAWLNGFLAGLLAGQMQQQFAAPPAPKTPLLILFGSQTGSAEQLARKIGRESEKHDFAPRVLPMSDFSKIDLTKEQRVLIVTSTWGDGDPPDNAVAFWNFLSSDAAPKLRQMQFSVLALGDSSYTDFCGAGKKFDARLEQLGAMRFYPRADCDKEYEATASGWIDGLWPALKKSVANQTPIVGSGAETKVDPNTNGQAPIPVSLGAKTNESNPTQTSPAFNRTNPFPARLLTHRKLNEGQKETRHFEISIEGSGLTYETGDALGIFPANCPELVGKIIQKLGCDGEEEVVTSDGVKTSFRAALQRNCEIHKISPQLLKAAAEKCDALHKLLLPENKSKLDEYINGRNVLDLLTDFSIKLSAAEVVTNLRKLPPRLYSIASSPKVHPNNIHLTVAIVRSELHGRLRKGVCSTFLAERASDKTPVPVFLQSSANFRLPQNSDTPIIMVGPGTGIAPFRAFLQERAATGAPGRNWLFFGHQHAATDYFYRDELLDWQSQKILTRLHTAFSRDQQDKIYVQHRLLENAREVWSWLNDGAHFYVCGDASRMARDVDATLHQIAEQAGGLSKDNAAAFVTELRKTKRYQRDVY